MMCFIISFGEAAFRHFAYWLPFRESRLATILYNIFVQDREKQEALRKAAEELRYITADYAQGQDIVGSQVARLQVLTHLSISLPYLKISMILYINKLLFPHLSY